MFRRHVFEGFDFRHAFFDDAFDACGEGDAAHAAAVASADHADTEETCVFVEVQEFAVAAVKLECGTNFVQCGFNRFYDAHKRG